MWGDPVSEAYYVDDTVTLMHGDALDCARALPTASVQCIVTSPPYYGLRDYGDTEQLGAEDTLTEYVDRMVVLFRELRRTLADDGTLWLNLGDSYAGSNKGSFGSPEAAGAYLSKTKQSVVPTRTDTTGRVAEGYKPKDLMLVPTEVARALRLDGWYLRSDIIWAKPNPMPESAADRPTSAHEHMFLLAKSLRYYYDAAAIAEPAVYRGEPKPGRQEAATQTGGAHSRTLGAERADGLRNKRSVWEVPASPFGEAHFAVYPPELVRPCIRAGSRPGDTVLDPFSGSGTTGMVATQEGRKYVGFDLNSDYLDMSLRTRFAQPSLNMGGAA